MDFITFYNKNGKAIAYLSERDDETIYLFNGTISSEIILLANKVSIFLEMNLFIGLAPYS